MAVASKSPARGYVPIKELARELQISFHFLTKVLQILTQANILKSYRGPNGGIALARSGRDIRLKDIVQAIDGNKLFENCVLGLSGCGTLKPCPLHDTWDRLRTSLEQTLADLTLDVLRTRLQRLDFRISD